MDIELRQRICHHLNHAGFNAVVDVTKYPGGNPANICNIGGRGMGIQLEISRGLRAQLFNDLIPLRKHVPTQDLHRFVTAIREALEPFKLPTMACVCEGTDQ